MSKNLYLIRHAKSSWKDASLSDHDRPLNKRGKHDAPLMAKALHKAGAAPDLLLSSTAVRARKTAEAFAEEFDIEKKDIRLTEKLYEAWPEDFISVIKDVEEKFKTVMLFSHNPGITAFANRLSDSDILNVPTCGVCHIKIRHAWSGIEFKIGKLITFDFPKNHYK